MAGNVSAYLVWRIRSLVKAIADKATSCYLSTVIKGSNETRTFYYTEPAKLNMHIVRVSTRHTPIYFYTCPVIFQTINAAITDITIPISISLVLKLIVLIIAVVMLVVGLSLVVKGVVGLVKVFVDSFFND